MKRSIFSVCVILGLMVAACGRVPGTDTSIQGGSITGLVHAGPVCPVVQNPPDPNCDDRPVAGAVMAVIDADGTEVDRLVSAPDGTFSADLPTGSYTLVPQPVDGLMGTASPQEFNVAADETTTLDIAYDTGIR